MNLDAKTLSEHIYFAENLKAAVSELSVTQAELARAIGKDQKTVGRYISGETYPEGSIAQIAEYLANRSVDDDIFAHIPSEKFEKLFSDICIFLQDNKMSETEFAEMAQISQKTLNNYKNYHFNNKKTLRLSTETQHKIVDAFNKSDDRFFPFHPDDDDENQAEVRNRYYKIVRRTYDYMGCLIVSSVCETWERLIESYKKGVNFFVYSPKKLELVCFYLHFMIRGINEMRHNAECRMCEEGACPNYFLRKDIASLDFMFEPHDDLDGGNFGKWTYDDDQTPNYWCDLVCGGIGRFWETYNMFSLREKNETNALLRKVYISKTRKIKQEREYYKTINPSAFIFNINKEKDQKEKISDKTIEELAEIFARQPPGLQETILRCYNVFFWGISFDNIDEVLEAHYWLTLTETETKLKFIERYEAEIMGDFWSTGCGLDADYHEKYDDRNAGLWEECSQYLQLMSYARYAKTWAFYNPSSKYTKEFRKLCRGLAKDIDPAYMLSVQSYYTPADWYANMLADIALLKG
ncbi:MAG: helix-turn-helix domain-containing protein, partial [Oscillospiraceae bacterium]|nr:helix-turn-helix domain-containing protein [Oscillospiraceae bacterium]